MQEYTQQQLATQLTALGQMFDEVTLVDPATSTRLDPVSLEPVGPADAVPMLDGSGRAWMPQKQGESTMLVLYQAICAMGRPCVLAAAYDLPHTVPANSRDANAFLRLLNQYRAELCHDYVTGVYNRSYLDGAFRAGVVAQAQAGVPVSAVVVRVNEYAQLCAQEGGAAADRCLNTAAGILQIAVGLDQEKNTLVRLEDGIFLVVAVGPDAAKMPATLRCALDDSRKGFSITLSRRGEFTAAVASAAWGETGDWDVMLSLALHRLRNS